MIVDRITAIRAIHPKIVVTDVPMFRVSRKVVSACVIRSGELQISEGTTGAILDVSYEEIDIELYAPRDVLDFRINADRSGPN